MPKKLWYNQLVRSKLSPPNYVFGMAWTILYTVLAISFYMLISDKKCVGICKPIPFFVIQMIFNLMWTTIFFKFRMIRTALACTLLIIYFTILTYTEMIKINVAAARLLIPYLLWLSFAFYLNFFIVVNN